MFALSLSNLAAQTALLEVPRTDASAPAAGPKLRAAPCVGSASLLRLGERRGGGPNGFTPAAFSSAPSRIHADAGDCRGARLGGGSSMDRGVAGAHTGSSAERTGNRVGDVAEGASVCVLSSWGTRAASQEAGVLLKAAKELPIDDAELPRTIERTLSQESVTTTGVVLQLSRPSSID